MKNIDRVAKGLNAVPEYFDDKSASWITLENATHKVSIDFCGKGQEFMGIAIFEKVWEVVTENLVQEFKPIQKL